MSRVSLDVDVIVPEGVDAVARLIFNDLDAREGGAFPTEVATIRGFSGKVGEVLWNGAEIYVGLGARDALTPEVIRRVGAAVVKAARSCESIALVVPTLASDGLDEAFVARALAEGALLVSYRFDVFRSAPSPERLARVVLVGSSLDSLGEGVVRAELESEVVSFARDLVNTPPSSLTPQRFVELATERANAESLDVQVYEEAELKDEGFGGLIGVSRGSTEPPRLVRLTYEPATPSSTTVALVGKGVTFDSGGLSLKTGEGMMTMKTDMSGAAAVLSTLLACRRAEIAVRVVGYMPLTENMPGGSAMKPGDVLTIRNGKTIEVLNTDAEGRLILADALSLAVEGRPDAIIDLATLTGACVMALGTAIAGVIGNDDRLIDTVCAASRQTGEPMWPLPLPSGYRSRLDSEVADMRNIPGTGSGAGALTAALVLEEFVGETPWVHLDIAGPARASEEQGYLTKGGTGFGVRTLIELLEHYEPLGGKALGSLGKAVLD